MDWKLVAIPIALTASMASASPSCLTMHQARAQYPDAHLHWRGKHCWHAAQHHHEAHSAPIPRPRPAAPPPPSSPPPVAEDAGAPEPEPPQVQIVRRWPAEVMSEAITDRWPDIHATRAPPRAPIALPPIKSQGLAGAYAIVLITILLMLFLYLFGEDILHDLAQRRSLFEKQELI